MPSNHCLWMLCSISFQIHEPVSEARSVIRSLKNPSDANVKALARLFPACSSGRKKRSFDPTSDCVATEQQRKKKAATPHAKGRSKCLKVVLLKEFPACVPKGGLRVRLTKMGRVKDISFTRILSNVEVESIILNRFEDLGVKKFKFLQACKDNSLKLAENQTLDGNSTIGLAGSGSLYLQQTSISDDGPSTSGTSSESGVNKKKRISISSDEADMPDRVRT